MGATAMPKGRWNKPICVLITVGSVVLVLVAGRL